MQCGSRAYARCARCRPYGTRVRVDSLPRAYALGYYYFAASAAWSLQIPCYPKTGCRRSRARAPALHELNRLSPLAWDVLQSLPQKLGYTVGHAWPRDGWGFEDVVNRYGTVLLGRKVRGTVERRSPAWSAIGGLALFLIAVGVCAGWTSDGRGSGQRDRSELLQRRLTCCRLGTAGCRRGRGSRVGLTCQSTFSIRITFWLHSILKNFSSGCRIVRLAMPIGWCMPWSLRCRAEQW